MPNLEIISYRDEYQESFKALNLAWIAEHFRVEPKDLDQVNNPRRCLAEGGEIFFARNGREVVGTCALYRISPKTFELAKMAVRSDHRGRGIGHRLMKSAENWAMLRGAEEILILSNTLLAPAISLYQKHGYAISRLGPHPDYERCNIEMRKNISPRAEE